MYKAALYIYYDDIRIYIYRISCPPASDLYPTPPSRHWRKRAYEVCMCAAILQ